MYIDMMEKWYSENIDAQWMPLRHRIMGLLQDEAELEEIVKLVGMDALNAQDRLKLEAARSIREDYLHQDAFHEIDTYASLDKQCIMMKLMLDYFDITSKAVEDGKPVQALIDLEVRERIGRIKYVSEDKVKAEYDDIISELKKAVDAIKRVDED